MKKEFLWSALGLLGGLMVAAALIISQPHKMAGSVIEPPAPAPAIDLGDFHLSEQKGKAVLIFFGYTYCPDVCPATLGELKQVLKRLDKQAEEVVVLFITVDPKRDTAEKMTQYSAAFDPRIYGLTGSMAELEAVWQGYGVYRAEQPTKNEGSYVVDHSTRTYLIDREGNLLETFAFGTPVDDILADVKVVLSN
jgi:protein SCO1/2